MATSAAVAVDDDPVVALITATGTARDISIRNNGPNTVYIGGPTVTSAAGYPLASGEDGSFVVGAAEVLHGVCASGETAALRVLQVSSE
jgi:hypothetical protein